MVYVPNTIYTAPVNFTGGGILYANKKAFEILRNPIGSGTELFGEFNVHTRLGHHMGDPAALMVEATRIPENCRFIKLLDYKCSTDQLLIKFMFNDIQFAAELQHEYDIAPDHFVLDTRFVRSEVFLPNITNDPNYGKCYTFITVDLRRIIPRGPQSIQNQFKGEKWV